MVHDYKFIKDNLPSNSISELMYLALNNFKKCYLMEEYKVNNIFFHSGGNKCHINLLGALLLDSGIRPTDYCKPEMFIYSIKKKLYIMSLVLEEEYFKAVDIFNEKGIIDIPEILPENFKVKYERDLDEYSNKIIKLINNIPQ
ncbi:MAG TPA: hypothetical protein VIK77_08170 [Tissierellaceae bacterium]